MTALAASLEQSLSCLPVWGELEPVMDLDQTAETGDGLVLGRHAFDGLGAKSDSLSPESLEGMALIREVGGSGPDLEASMVRCDAVLLFMPVMRAFAADSAPLLASASALGVPLWIVLTRLDRVQDPAEVSRELAETHLGRLPSRSNLFCEQDGTTGWIGLVAKRIEVAGEDLRRAGIARRRAWLRRRCLTVLAAERNRLIGRTASLGDKRQVAEDGMASLRVQARSGMTSLREARDGMFQVFRDWADQLDELFEADGATGEEGQLAGDPGRQTESKREALYRKTSESVDRLVQELGPGLSGAFLHGLRGKLESWCEMARSDLAKYFAPVWEEIRGGEPLTFELHPSAFDRQIESLCCRTAEIVQSAVNHMKASVPQTGMGKLMDSLKTLVSSEGRIRQAAEVLEEIERKNIRRNLLDAVDEAIEQLDRQIRVEIDGLEEVLNEAVEAAAQPARKEVEAACSRMDDALKRISRAEELVRDV